VFHLSLVDVDEARLSALAADVGRRQLAVVSYMTTAASV
jgi:hypothetical protein